MGSFSRLFVSVVGDIFDLVEVFFVEPSDVVAVVIVF